MVTQLEDDGHTAERRRIDFTLTTNHRYEKRW